MARTVADYSMQYAKGLANGYHTVWAFFAPNYVFLEQVAQMVDRGQIRAIVDTVYPFEKLPEGFRQVQSGDTKGKVIVQISEWLGLLESVVIGLKLSAFVVDVNHGKTNDTRDWLYFPLV